MNYTHNPYTDILHKHPHKECTRCVMNTSDPSIYFNEEGVCNHCQAYDAYIGTIGNLENRQKKLDNIVAQLKDRGKDKAYDCIMGLSGGVDSSYLAWYAVKILGLRPLVVHVDTGWNSELAVNNIQSIVQKLCIDLHTLVIDWDEIKDIQRAYFFSGVANLDVPQDHAFIASLYREAKKYGIRDVLNGGNMQTESVLPAAWGYDASDSVNLRAIHQKFGHKPLRSYPIITAYQRLIFNPYMLGMRVHRPLEYISYEKEAAKQLLKNELGWRDYGGKHYESVFTKFHQAYYLPTKFGYDKRLAHLSSLIISGQMSKQAALLELEEPLYDDNTLREEMKYWLKKVNITQSEFDQVMLDKPRLATDYPTDKKQKEIIGKIFSFAIKVRNTMR